MYPSTRLKSQNEGIQKGQSAPATSEDVIIAFMGVTGSGKSSFIKALTRRSDITVGKGLSSTTCTVQAYRVLIKSTSFVLVDTPGFNDTHRSNGDILKQIAEWLNCTYRQGAKLTGIIYLHPIRETRMEGSALLNFRAFQRLCGEDNFEHIFLCTTFWDIIDEAKGAAREKELCENPEFWAKMMNQGSRVVRVKDYAQSEEILLQMAQKSTVTLDIQKEMVEERRSLDDTAVGKTVNAQLAQLKAEHEAQLAKARRDAEIALKIRDEENQKRAQEQLRHHESVKEAQEKLLREQKVEGERLRARLEAMEREAETHTHREQKRLEEIKAENKRLEAERERLRNESAKRQADEHRRLVTKPPPRKAAWNGIRKAVWL
ncbi:MAG: hypothetical protein Q9191_005953 [Dirinaria sp. TL-2023a]